MNPEAYAPHPNPSSRYSAADVFVAEGGGRQAGGREEAGGQGAGREGGIGAIRDVGASQGIGAVRGMGAIAAREGVQEARFQDTRELRANGSKNEQTAPTAAVVDVERERDEAKSKLDNLERVSAKLQVLASAPRVEMFQDLGTPQLKVFLAQMKR